MDSTRLRYFVTVSETASIRKAAELLRLSPAALSKAISILEDEVGFQLCVPLGRGIAITDRGRELATKAKPLLESLSTLAVSVKDQFDVLDDALRPVRIGTFEVFSTYFLSEFLQNLPSSYSLLLREVVPGELERALVDRHVDFGLTYIPIPTSGIEHQQVSSIEMGVYGTKSLIHSISTKDIGDIPFVIPIQPISGSPNKVQGLDGWPDDKIPRFAKYKVTLMESALEICRQGLAVCYIPTFIARLHNDQMKSKFMLEPLTSNKRLPVGKHGVYIARRKTDEEGEVFKKLAKTLRMSCAK